MDDGYHEVFYLESGHGTITDFRRSEGDKIQIAGELSDYTLGTGHFGGTGALDRTIFYRDDLIGVVLDNTTVSLSEDFVFATLTNN